MSVLVVDVSSNNAHPIDYGAAARSGLGGAVVKLTEGADQSAYVNPYATEDVAGFRAAGLPVAGYHFLHPTVSIADQLALIEAHRDAVSFVWVDSEMPGANASATARATRQMCAALAGAGLKVGLYTGLDFLNSMPGAPFGYLLWLADYGPPQPPRPCAMWQYTDAGSLTGIAGPVDLSHYYGTEAELRLLFAPPALAPHPAPPPAPHPREEEMVWLDRDPNNGDAILVVPAQGGWWGISAEKLAYYRDNSVPEAKTPISAAVFASLKKLG